MNLADVKVYNFQQEQKEVVSYLTHSEVATLKQVIRDKVKGDIAKRVSKRKQECVMAHRPD